MQWSTIEPQHGCGRWDTAIGALLLVVAAGALLNAAYGAYASARDRQRFPPPGDLVDVGGGRRLHLWRRGTGAPTVVFLTALGSPCLEWTSVADAVGECTTVLLYDRPGLGWSDREPGLPTVGRMAEDLRHVLLTVDLPAPYILVGHSLGGYVARLYVARWPDDVAGLVLVDAPHEKQGEYIRLLDWRTRVRGLLIRAGAGLRRLLPSGLVRLVIDIGWAEGRRRRVCECFPPEYIDAGLALSMRSGLRRATAGEVHALLSLDPPRRFWGAGS